MNLSSFYMDLSFDFICLYPFSVWQKPPGVWPGEVKAKVPSGSRAHDSFLSCGTGHFPLCTVREAMMVTRRTLSLHLVCHDATRVEQRRVPHHYLTE